jgi:hypothetical protein
VDPSINQAPRQNTFQKRPSRETIHQIAIAFGMETKRQPLGWFRPANPAIPCAAKRDP